MWTIEYSEEVKYYFIDNDPYAFDLLVRIEELKYTDDGIPPEGSLELEPGFFWWRVLHHIVIYERITAPSPRLIIAVVKPL